MDCLHKSQLFKNRRIGLLIFQRNSYICKHFLFLFCFYLFSNDICSQDIFVRVSLSKEQVIEQEPVVLTFIVYSKYTVTNFIGNYPSLNDFTIYELPLGDGDKGENIIINGEEYRKDVWKKYLLFPLHPGNLEIPSMSFSSKVIIPYSSDDLIDDFINGGTGFVESTRQLKTSPAYVEVKALNWKPSNYSGGVGRFKIEGRVDSTITRVGHYVKMLVSVTGQGNIDYVIQPKLELPRSFDLIESRVVNDSIVFNERGTQGYRLYEFTLSARYCGEFDIPPVQFVYYDVDSLNYVTTKTIPFHISVTRGESTRDADSLRDIKTGDISRGSNRDSFWGSKLFFFIIIFVIFIFVVIVKLLQIMRKKKYDMQGKRFSKAEYEALQQLKVAQIELENGNEIHFYSIVHKALSQYIKDRLFLKQEELSQNVICQLFDDNLVDKETKELFLDLLNKCESFKYGNSVITDNSNELYMDAVAVIKRLNMSLQKRRVKVC